MITPYYIFDADAFIENYKELEEAFLGEYPNYRIAYSFKTNYTPAVCCIVRDLGGYAEVVSDMEYDLACRLGFPANRIVFNGPGKGDILSEGLLSGCLLNIDNYREIGIVCELAKQNKGLAVGIRANFDIGNGLHSRFGIDASSDSLLEAVSSLNSHGVICRGLHFHISRARDLPAWKARIDGLIAIADAVEMLQGTPIEYLDIGSGMFGKLDDCLKEQFPRVPSYHEYAAVVGGAMANHYSHRENKPVLLSEPGTTLVSKYFSLVSKVLDIKTIREKTFALLDCSFHNAGEICQMKKIPVEIASKAGKGQFYDAVDFVGYTCLEQDVICHSYSGEIGVGDAVVFRNVGGYSIVNKPPFIHPDIPIYMDRSSQRVCVKRAQTLDDIMRPYLDYY